jgi:hypothetical protein
MFPAALRLPVVSVVFPHGTLDVLGHEGVALANCNLQTLFQCTLAVGHFFLAVFAARLNAASVGRLEFPLRLGCFPALRRALMLA